MKQKRLLIPAGIVLIVVLLVVLLLRGGGGSGNSQQIENGIEYLKSLESGDTDTVEEILAMQRQQRISEQREERMRQMSEGEIDVWSLFTDYVLMGDSRAVGFSYYDYMPEERVVAGAGWTIRDIEPNLDSVRAMNPSSIYLCFGLNDTSIGYWETPDEYAQEYLQVVQMLQGVFPNAVIYVNSTLPARDPAFEQAEKWHEIPDYSAAVGEICASNGIPFVNNDQIAADHAELYDPDGIHLQREFYPYWAANMMLTVYGEDIGDVPAPSGSDTGESSGESSEEGTSDYDSSYDYDESYDYDSSYDYDESYDYDSSYDYDESYDYDYDESYDYDSGY